MKGSIFKHFESFVVDNFGEELWEDILDDVTLKTEGPFLGPENYPDEDLLTIVGTTIGKLGVPLPDALRLFGKYLFYKLEGDAPHLVANAQDLPTLLDIIDGVIHVEVKKLSPLAYLPKIKYESRGENKATMQYHSQRQFCQLFLGLIEGASERFDTELASWEETTCTHKGDEHCTFDFEFKRAA